MGMLKPQDILVSLKLVAGGERRWTYEAIGASLNMSLSATHSAVGRAGRCGLVHADSFEPNREALLEFLVHGIGYVYPAEYGRRRRGIPTGPSAAPLAGRLVATDEEPLVWPHPKGKVRGEALAPFHPNVPFAAMNDERLYELLAVVDALRIGGARLREVAAELLEELLFE